MDDSRITLRQLRDQVQAFVDQRQWRRFHDPKNLSMSIAIEAAELMEHFQWARSEELAAILDDPQRRDEIRDEIADIACYLLSLANRLDLDLSSAVTQKLAKNSAKYPVEEFQGRYHKPKPGPAAPRSEG